MRLAALLAALVLGGPALGQTSPNPSFSLANKAAQPINELYATPAGVDRWGRDRLGSNSLTPGMNFPVRLPADGNCIYDIRVVYADGQSEEKRRINTCQTETVTFPGGRTSGTVSNRAPAATDDPSFRLVNRAKAEVNEVYVSLTGEDSWGRDRLGDETVAVGATRVIRLPSGQCQYDVRVVFANGEATEKRRLNLCTITDLRVP